MKETPEESHTNPDEDLKFEQVLRHGDVIVFKLKDAGDAGRFGRSASELILARGEITGHAHRLRGDVVVFEGDEASGKTAPESDGEIIPERMLFRVLNSATLTHEEHDPIVLEPGLYLKVNQVEFDPFARMIRSVQD